MARLGFGWGLLAWVAIALGGCPGDTSTDAGPPPFEGTALGGGYTDCGDVVCQPGQRCEEENLCYLGCAAGDECADGEICDFQPGLGGTCAYPDTATCGDGLCSLGEVEATCPGDCAGVTCDDDVKGQIACGDTTCGPGFYCANPAEGLCYEGCLSIENCGCGRRCNATPGQPGNCTVPITPAMPVCGDGICEDPERPQNCLQDCSWEDRCFTECQELDIEECFSPGEQDLCFNRCGASTDEQREAFGFCIFLNGGSAGCPTACQDELDDGQVWDGGIPP